MKKILSIIAILCLDNAVLSQNVYSNIFDYYNQDTSHVVVVGKFDFLDTLNLLKPSEPNYVSPEELDLIQASIDMDVVGVKFVSMLQLPYLQIRNHDVEEVIVQCTREFMRRVALFDQSKVNSFDYFGSIDSLGIQQVDSSGIFVNVKLAEGASGQLLFTISPEHNIFMCDVLLGAQCDGQVAPHNYLGCFYANDILCVVEAVDAININRIKSFFCETNLFVNLNIYKREVDFGTPFGHYDCEFSPVVDEN